MKSGKSETTERKELRSQETMRTLREKNYKYVGILEADTIKQTEMKEKVRKEYFRRTIKLLETNLCCRNFIKGIIPGQIPCKIPRNIHKMGNGETRMYLVTTNYTCTYTCWNITNNNDERRYFLRKIYLSHFIWNGWKGLWKGYVWEVSWRLNKLQHIDPPVPLSSAALLSHSAGLLNRGSWGGCWFSLQHLISN